MQTDPTTRTHDYFERIGRVQDYIYTHLDAPLDLDTLADIACLSRFHWHRVYRAMTGETAAQTVRRLRLARAALELASTHIGLNAISARAGYSTQSAFTRAFAAAYGTPPAQFRTSGRHVELIRAAQEVNRKRCSAHTLTASAPIFA